METLREIRQALENLSISDRRTIGLWLERLDEFAVAEPAVKYAATEPYFMTLEEFFEFEGHPELRYEYIDGAVFAMTGPSVIHQRLSSRLMNTLQNHIGKGPCEVFSSGMQLVIRREASEMCYLPDIIVDCRRDTWGKQFVRDPKLIIEVLSPSTQHIDRREKLQNYRSVDSLEEYILVAQDEPKLLIHRRQDGWRPQIQAGWATAAEFRSIGLALPLESLYEDILPKNC